MLSDKGSVVASLNVTDVIDHGKQSVTILVSHICKQKISGN